MRPAGRGEQDPDSYADSHSEQQSANFPEHLGILFASKSVGGAAQAVGRGFIRFPGFAFDVVDVVRHTFTQVIEQRKAGAEQDAKELLAS